MYENNVTNNLKGASVKVKPVKLPNVSLGTSSTNGVVNSRSIKPTMPTGKSAGMPNMSPAMSNLLPPVPVADKINLGMRHTALSADGKSKVNAMKHLPNPQPIPGLMGGPSPMGNSGPMGPGNGPSGF